jgi:hypothetical protein
MSEQILARLKRKLDELATGARVDAETSRNALKEELWLYVLNFIYHHPKYSKWIMYGGSALRIVHGLDRMSVDLDFEISQPITKEFLEEFRKEIEGHFTNLYGAGADFLTVKITNGRGLTLKFHVGEELSFGHPSKQVHVKIDLNQFVAPKTVTERRPINRDQLSFVITTYNMGSLMASKIAAIFLRGTRGAAKATYEEKGRDIYDLLWCMDKKVIPDIDYLNAKDVDAIDLRSLFDKLTLQMNKVREENLKQDLLPLFVDRSYIENWIKNWRESYLRLLDEYKITTVTMLAKVRLWQNPKTSNYLFTYTYDTEDKISVFIHYITSDYWIDFSSGDLTIEIDHTLDDITEIPTERFSRRPALQDDLKAKDKLRQYATLFYQKSEKYLEKTNRIMLGDEIVTKIIRLTADKFNQKEEIVLTRSALLSCELDDLLK